MWNEDEDLADLDVEQVAGKDYDPSSEHPSPEYLLLKLAIESLTAKQRKIWDMYAYDQMTHEQIAVIMKINQSNVTRNIQTIENKIKKFCKQNKGAYILLKMDSKIMNGDIL